MAAVTPEIIVDRSTVFLDEVISQQDLRRRLLAAARRRLDAPDPICLQALALLSQYLDSSSSSSSSSTAAAAAAAKPAGSTLRTAEKLLLTLPSKTALAFLLSALVHAVRNRKLEAAISLLELFAIDPSPARYEIAAPLFEDLFIPHLLPAIQWFADKRSRIIASSTLELEDNDGRSIEAATAMSLLSRMSGIQTAELKLLEKGYEGVLDENTRAYAGYLKEVLVMHDRGWEALPPPQLVLTRIGDLADRLAEDERDIDGVEEEEEDNTDVDDEEEDLGDRRSSRMNGLNSRNGRYNPIWADADQSTESTTSRQSSQSQGKMTTKPSIYPQRVPAHLLHRQPSTESPSDAGYQISDLGRASSFDDNSEYSDSEFDNGMEEKHARGGSSYEADEIDYEDDVQTGAGTHRPSMKMVDSDSNLAYGKHTPPKDFVCPITSNLFNDPVTLETGQTYERKAIQEWLDRGNCTCPITRHKLQSIQLPKTNYVLKRLIASWIEQSSQSIRRSEDQYMEDEGSSPLVRPESTLPPPMETSPSFDALKRAPSPRSVISQANMDTTASSELRLAISHLCTSDVLNESEMAVLQIEQFWRMDSSEPELQIALSKPAVVNGFVEILFNSVKPQILRAAVFMLTELASRDKFVVQTLNSVDSDVECMVDLFKNGLVEAVVLIYLLNPSKQILIEMDMLDALVLAVKRKEDEPLEMCLKPRTASLLLLSQLMRVENGESLGTLVNSLISERTIDCVIQSLEADLLSERMAAVQILLKCMDEDGNCRNVIADKVELSPVLESFTIVNDVERFEIVQFLAELVKLNRRTFNEQLLHIIKDEGAFSTRHSLLVYLQTALRDQAPVIASLLLQLDVLVEPRKMSIYREEAVDALISCLRNQDFPTNQLVASEIVVSLQGRFSSSGRSLTRAYLLKRAGMNKSFRSIMRAEQMGHVLSGSDENQEEENAAEEWERRVAFSLVSHEFGLLFEVLAEGLKSRNSELFSACLVSSSWLANILSILPDMGIQGAARVCLLKQFVAIFKSSRDTDDRALAMLGLRSFMHDPEGLHDLSSHMKDILKTLRELKKSSALAYEMLKLFSNGQESSIEMWNHRELAQIDCSINGEVLAIICFKNWIISGHSDGCIKVWSGIDNILHLIQENHDHSKAITSLVVSGDKVYSGSLDKTVKVWAIRKGEIHCTETHDVKDPVSNLCVVNNIACFIPQGAGIKVLTWNGGMKLLNSSKNVKSLALIQGKIYCGCHDNGVQEIDLATGTVGTIQGGNRKLLAKANPVYVTRVHEGLLYAASSPLEGAAVKIWDTSNYSMVGSLPCSLDVRSLVVSQDLIYLGCKLGVLEIWSRNKHTRVANLQMGGGTAGKIHCIAVDGDGELVVAGSSDGKIQAWGLT